MATYQALKELRYSIGDQPILAFNETTSDGENASWRVTNSPIQIASESVYVSGILQQSSSIVASALLVDAVTEGETELNLAGQSSSFSVGDFITLETVPDPYKFRITSIDSGVLTINRETEDPYAADTQLYDITKEYTIDYDGGIVYFDAPWESGTDIIVKFKYTRHSDKALNLFIDMATKDVARDIGDTVSSSDEDQMSLVLLKAKIAVLQKEVVAGAASSIKIKQGSTSLDLTGATHTTSREIERLKEDYQIALERYLYNQSDLGLGEAVVGREDYLTS